MLILAPVDLLFVGACFGVLPGWLSAVLLLFSGSLMCRYRGSNSVDWATFRSSVVFGAPLGMLTRLADCFPGAWAKGGKVEQ
ncbi:hypothetical protein AB838_09865 [Rhodobacteraceae bacterium (ex Bugula neritina AB1)]|nr:hypothetical protein AB838_09865 [Rhodobacteraceae bacterium (ex Bugula neritina AB1)]